MKKRNPMAGTLRLFKPKIVPDKRLLKKQREIDEYLWDGGSEGADDGSEDV